MRELRKIEIQRGMMVRIKDDISKSAKMYGMNTEKEKFAGKIKKIQSVSHNKTAIKIYRDPEDVRNYRKGRTYWTFHITDIELPYDISDIDELEKEKNVEHLFDPKKLII